MQINSTKWENNKLYGNALTKQLNGLRPSFYTYFLTCCMVILLDCKIDELLVWGFSILFLRFGNSCPIMTTLKVVTFVRRLMSTHTATGSGTRDCGGLGTEEWGCCIN